MASSRDTSNGPDWTDIAEAIAAVESYHNVTVGLQVNAPVIPQKGKVRIWAVALRLGPLPAGVKPSVSRSLLIGSSDTSQDTATIFRLVHELDRDCSQMWAQEDLFT